jgi:hypothetical protein
MRLCCGWRRSTASLVDFSAAPTVSTTGQLLSKSTSGGEPHHLVDGLLRTSASGGGVRYLGARRYNPAGVLPRRSAPAPAWNMTSTPSRRFQPPWTVDRMPGGYVVRDANGQQLAWVYARATEAEGDKRRCSRWTRHAGSRSGSSSCPALLRPTSATSQSSDGETSRSSSARQSFSIEKPKI